VHFVAATVADSLARFAPSPARELVVAGGGALNAAQLEALAARCSLPVLPSSAVGVDPKAREALVFAVLAAACALGMPLSHPGATGARPGRVLGKLSRGGCRTAEPG
jgi:anhydro-N-acetylmuramic acid kinase